MISPEWMFEAILRNNSPSYSGKGCAIPLHSRPENRLSIYPNPATNLIRINTGAEAWDNIPVRIDITDMHGRNVISMMTYELQAEINVAALRPGIYSVRTSKNGLVLGSAKFSKTHEN